MNTITLSATEVDLLRKGRISSALAAPAGEIKWFAVADHIPAFSVGSNAGGGAGIRIVGRGPDGRFYYRDVRARRIYGNPPSDREVNPEYERFKALPPLEKFVR